LSRNCKRCSQELPPGALVCDHCHALVHSEELERLSAEAKGLEARGDLRQAREKWVSALPLLPTNSTQADWIKRHAETLNTGGDPPQAAVASDNPWLQQRELVSPITGQAGRDPSPTKAGVKLTSILSFLAFVAIYSIGSGVKFGIGFAALILIHEMGHFVDIKRRGLPADMPVFLPGLGAYVRWQAMGVTRQTRAEVSLAGPLAGLLGAVLCAVMWKTGGGSVWAALARTSGWLNILNLTPVLIFDGGQAAHALNRAERFAVLVVCLLLWLYVHNVVLLIVAAGMVYRLTTKDLPPMGSTRVAAYFIGVLAGLALVVRLIPGQMFAPR